MRWIRTTTRVSLVAVTTLGMVGALLATAVPTAGAEIPDPIPAGALVADPAYVDGTACDADNVCSLGAAVAAAGGGDTVYVLPGTHEVSGELTLGSGVTIQGADAPPDAPGAPTPRASTIQGDGSGRMLVVAGTGVVIDGVVISGGDAGRQDGGGILMQRNTSLTLTDSTLSDNTARDGAGIAVERGATLSLARSTIVDNTATRKGGGLRNDGTATVDNVTITRNIADQGGGISSPGSTTVTHATIVQNAAGSSSSGGVDRNGGTLQISYSIIANNLRGEGSQNRDCSGTPDLLGLNLVSIVQGCNPIGDVIEADPLVGPAAPNGGPTETAALLDGSPAIDAIAVADCAVPVDQRGTARPTGPGCDLGAFEEAPLDASFALDVDTANYGGGSEVEVGVTSVPTDLILSELVSRGEDDPTSTIADSALRSIALRSIEIEDLALRSIDPEAAALRSIALRSIALRSIALRSIALRSIIIDDTALRSIALRSILLSDIALRSIDGGWEAFIAATPSLSQYVGVPLQAITIEDILEAGADFPADVTLDDVSLEASALRSIALRSILLADVALRSIPIPDADGVLQAPDSAGLDAAWCELLSELCGSEPGQIPSSALRSIDLLQVQLAGGNVDDVPIFDIPLSTALRSIALRSIALRSIKIEQTALRSIALRSIALRSIADGVDYIGAIVDCGADGGIYCSTDPSNDLVLGDVPDAALTGTVESIAGLPAELIEGLSFGDLLLAFVPPDDPGWESLDIDGALLQNISDPLQPTFDYVATVEVTGGPADLDVSLILPAGFAAARAPGDPSATFDGAPVTPETDNLSQLQFVITGVGSGVHTLRVPVRAGMTTGLGEDIGPAMGSVVATAGADIVTPDPDTAFVDVVAASSVEDGLGSTGLSFNDQLNLAHISREGDIDLYRLGGDTGVPADIDGETALIRLSNIPAGADYDLAAYAVRPAPLRGTPEIGLDALGDIGYDLDPTDDVFPTDVADDIQLDVPGARGLGDFTAVDVSSRRMNEDEEVSVLLEAGEIYYVAVTPYLQDFSDAPYGLRARVTSDVDPQECVGGRSLPAGSSPMAMPAVPTGVNTLYVTNTEWLAAELAAQGDTTTVADIVAAAAATAGVNGVVPMVVPIDADPTVRAAYTAWTGTADGRCDPDRRNDVVSAIGDVLDGITDANPTVENIVLIGGDGVVPMAAVPDLTKYSNESTFADEATDGVNGNEVSAALADGLLLTDDPYGTTAGISVQDGDHELFVPERNLGRLVETGTDILTQLQNFVTFDGQLDPVATPGALESGVTGYDFLDDGAEAVIGELDDVSTVSSLTGDAWDRADYIDLLTGDFDFVSPNAHYDWESLLPAAADAAGFFDRSDLVTTSDPDLTTPTNAVIFTMGCHAGLSLDDVQVGFAAADWAAKYAGSDNLYAAHTTYGYGDTDIVAYSERVMEIFAGNIADLVVDEQGAAETVGEAFRDAKLDYLASTLVLDPYDEKILQSLTFYGLPMYDVGGEVAPAAPSATLAATDTGAVTFDGLSVDIELTPTTGSSGPANINRVSTPVGDYFEVGGNVVAAQYRPVQPLVEAEIPDGTGPIGGFLITSLSSTDIAPFDPLILQPNLDLSANEGRVEPGDGSFPASLQRIAPALAGGPERLLVAAGQFDATIGGGQQRIFTDIGGELIPAADTGTDKAPVFLDVIGRIGESEAVVQFEITTDTTARRVYVLFREEGSSGPWRGLFLTRAGSTADEITWLGAAPVSAPGVLIELNAQSEGFNGRVGFTGNKVENFNAELPDEEQELVFLLDGPGPVNGYFTGDVTATVTNSAAPETLEYSVDSGPFVPGDSVTVSGDGGHVVLARDDAGAREFVFFVIDASGPTLTAAVFPDVPVANGPVNIGLSAVDVGQSGVDKIVYTIDGGPEAEVSDTSASIDITADGTTTVEAWAFDVAGNRSETYTRTITIDQTAPTVAATADPAAATTQYVNTDVTVTVEASDDRGVSAITIDGTDTTFDPATSPASASVTVTTDGTTTVTYGAADAAGNATADATIDVLIDKTAPTATLSVALNDDNGNGLPGPDAGDSATATFSCTDDLSGLASCEISVDGVPRPDLDNGDGTAGPLPFDVGPHTVTVTATDNAGNTFTTDAAEYAAPYDVCLQYDPSQARNIGANYTIRLTLCDASGTNLSDRSIELKAISINGGLPPGPNDSGNANNQFLFRYQANSDRYVYNLDTTGMETSPGPGPHTLDFKVTDADGTVSYGTAPFTLS